MYLTKLCLKDFRNIPYLDLELNQGVNIFYGDNAQGKTNLLEAVYLCATGRSQRTRVENQLIRFGQSSSHIQAFVSQKKRSLRIDVHIKKDQKKGVAVNGVAIKKLSDLFGTLRTVIFCPEDLQLVKESPVQRRRFMDIELCQLSAVYYYDIQQYYKVLKHRNQLLKQMQGRSQKEDMLFVWDEQLISYGKRIIEAREQFVQKIHMISSRIHQDLTGGKEELTVRYKPNVKAEDFMDKMKSHLERDYITGTTNVGPHKDDMGFFIGGNDVKTYGSQGQQRTAALSVKLAEIDLIREESGYSPVLLLDDVLSELDEKRQGYLLEKINHAQILLTCTGIEDSIRQHMGDCALFLVQNGSVQRVVS